MVYLCPVLVPVRASPVPSVVRGRATKFFGVLPVSPIFVRFCLRNRGKSYHRLLVLAVECLIVLVGYMYTSKCKMASTAPSVFHSRVALSYGGKN